MKKTYPIYIHETCQLFDQIYISAGQRGLQLKLNPEDLIRMTGAVVCDVAE
jgi:Cys-tRNA(Pro)/Cys-tRNA(Cys) deacylase